MNLIPILPFLFQVDRYLIIFLVILVGVFIYYRKRSRLLDYVIALLLTMSASNTIKYIINKPRPISDFIFEGSGFPSTHSAVAACVIFFYLLICHTPPETSEQVGKAVKKVFTTTEGLKCVLVILLGAMVMWLRVTLKAHEWVDVFAGIIVGYLVTMIFMFYDITGRKVK
jgi:membrane-associated phospholipid phosphatase